MTTTKSRTHRPWREIADTNWKLDQHAQHVGIQTAALLGIYNELKELNALLHCANAVAIPGILREIRGHTGETAANTKKRQRQPKGAQP